MKSSKWIIGFYEKGIVDITRGIRGGDNSEDKATKPRLITEENDETLCTSSCNQKRCCDYPSKIFRHEIKNFTPKRKVFLWYQQIGIQNLHKRAHLIFLNLTQSWVKKIGKKVILLCAANLMIASEQVVKYGNCTFSQQEKWLSRNSNRPCMCINFNVFYARPWIFNHLIFLVCGLLHGNYDLYNTLRDSKLATILSCLVASSIKSNEKSLNNDRSPFSHFQGLFDC